MTQYDGRWIYSRLRVCGHLTVVEKLYNDNFRTNKSLVGFTCEVTGSKSPEKFDKILEFITNHGLPVEVFDYPDHAKRFKIRILK
jgi:hypothetical protein